MRACELLFPPPVPIQNIPISVTSCLMGSLRLETKFGRILQAILTAKYDRT